MKEDEKEKRIVRAREASRILGVSMTTLWRMGKKDGFPQKVSVSSGAKGWFLCELLDWAETRKNHHKNVPS